MKIFKYVELNKNTMKHIEIPDEGKEFKFPEAINFEGNDNFDVSFLHDNTYFIKPKDTLGFDPNNYKKEIESLLRKVYMDGCKIGIQKSIKVISDSFNNV